MTETTTKTAEKTSKRGLDSKDLHLGYTAQVVVTPTFDTNTGKRLQNTEFMEYKCTECD